MFQDASCGFLPLPLLLFHPWKSRWWLIKIDVRFLSNHISICCFSIFHNWNHEPDETSHISFLCVTQLDCRLTSWLNCRCHLWVCCVFCVCVLDSVHMYTWVFFILFFLQTLFFAVLALCLHANRFLGHQNSSFYKFFSVWRFSEKCCFTVFVCIQESFKIVLVWTFLAGLFTFPGKYTSTLPLHLGREPSDGIFPVFY